MPKLVTVDQMVAIEQEANDSGAISYAQMMQNAGRAVAEVAKQCLAERSGTGRVAILVGPGNNGGDGLVTARILREETEAEVGAYLLRPRSDDVFEAAQQTDVFLANAEDDQRWRILRTMVNNADIIIDALLGTGIDLPLRDNVSDLLKQVAAATQPAPTDRILAWPAEPAPPEVSAAPVIIAVDCPTGLDSDTGQYDPQTLHADLTVTFAAAKVGHYTSPGAQTVGRLAIADIGIPPRLEAVQSVSTEVTTIASLRDKLPPRSAFSHKGTHGRALVVAGSRSFVGAAALCGEAAYRAGAGLVQLAVPQSIQPMLAPTLPEPIWVTLPEESGSITAEAAAPVVQAADQASAVLIGPGLTNTSGTHAFLAAFLQDAPSASLVIDADGLNSLSSLEGWPSRLPPETILTPHPGEMARLSGISVAEVQANRLDLARTKAAEWNVILVLKGAYTIIAHPDGRLMINPFAVDALATAGTGDVLAGCITGLCAQGADPFDAAVAAVYIHAVAGEQAQKSIGVSRSVVAGDVLAHLGEAFRESESPSP